MFAMAGFFAPGAVVTYPAVTYDASVRVVSASSLSSQTISHTVGSGVNRLLVVSVVINAPATAGVVYSVASVTYNGVALTKLVAADRPANSAGYATELWYLINPPSGAHSTVVTLSNAASFGFGVISFAGANQSIPFRTPQPYYGTGTTTSVTTTGGAATDMILCAGGAPNNTDTYGASQTLRYQNGTTSIQVYGTTQAGAAGSVVSNVNCTANVIQAYYAVAIMNPGG